MKSFKRSSNNPLHKASINNNFPNITINNDVNTIVTELHQEITKENVTRLFIVMKLITWLKPLFQIIISSDSDPSLEK